jgi:hypothetical protein
VQELVGEAEDISSRRARIIEGTSNLDLFFLYEAWSGCMALAETNAELLAQVVVLYTMVKKLLSPSRSHRKRTGINEKKVVLFTLRRFIGGSLQIYLSIWNQKLDRKLNRIGFVRTMDRFSVQKSKNEFKQN